MMFRPGLYWAIACLVTGLVVQGCSGPPAPKPASPPAPQAQAGYKLGQPYQINGTWYYPSADFNYDETGIASWYGPDFDQKVTANGEIFDQNLASAAHKTMALPTIVQVTNLDNGRSIEVRVNDRGPFVGNRILDVSRRAAQLLGFEEVGTAKVRVRVVAPETMQAQSIARHNGGEGTGDEASPPAVPHGTVVAQTLPPPGSNAPPQPVPPAPIPPPAPLAAVPASAPVSETVYLLPVKQTHLFIQAGAFASGTNATRMKSLLDGLGPVAVTGTRVNGIDVFRVRLGPIASVDEADRLLSRVVQAGAGEAKIVVD
ncbi:MAG: septal ring lytic transglycosylase RlpA family protein [Aliidongia sp.]|jgi:rare lipoprotein A